MPFLDAEQLKKRLDAMSKLEEKLSFRIARLAKLMETHAVRTLGEAPLSLTGYRIMMSVELFEETSAADLGHVLLIDRAQISRSVRDLMEQGFLLTRPDPGSKRRKLLRLSEEGQALLETVKPAFARRQEGFISALEETEAVALNDAIATLTSHLAQALEDTGKADTDSRG
ncbi:MarR family winged helix-turn-helix transcriptional regulator [Tritonibacter scottomollicae]|uniref:MarR family winged helix-turn-helix transcriptional regulator n=1 Tax=Tritonibacter scottomollicae TaxID=483013 RepID=UPI003BA9D423